MTIVFADLAGSTALGERLDPEALRDLHTRYFAAMRRPLERHGGTIEKYIGDAVMAVFGIPVLHEDDALRAVRAAVEMRDAMAELNRELERDLGVGLELRIGINTGEVAGIDGVTDHGFVSGDAVNTAARLQSAAPPGGIVIGPQTRRLVEGAVRLRSHGPVEAKGKRRPLRVWQVERLVDTAGPVHAAAPPSRSSAGAPSCDGSRPGFAARWTATDACSSRSRGRPGSGKSRILKEFAAGIEDEATVVVGRCLPYGEGITYWPLIEIVNDLAGVTGTAEIEGLLAGDSQPQVVASRVAAAAGPQRCERDRGRRPVGRPPPVRGARPPPAAGRRVRRHPLGRAGDARPDRARRRQRAAAPILIVCLARGDLLERRPEWAARGRARQRRPARAAVRHRFGPPARAAWLPGGAPRCGARR